MKNKIRLFIFFLFLISNHNSLIAQENNMKEKILSSYGFVHGEKVFNAIDDLIVHLKSGEIKENMIYGKEKSFSLNQINSISKSIEYYNTDTSEIELKLLNAFPFPNNRYKLQFSLTDKKDIENPLKMIFEIMAHANDNSIQFSSILDYHTSFWRTKKYGHVTYYYREKINEDRAQSFAQKNVMLATRFKKEPVALNFYMVENYQEILPLLGYVYDESSIGKIRDGLGVLENVIFSVMNNEDFSHDLFHFYANTVHEKATSNWVAHEGLAYSWGNAYYTNINNGEMADQKELVEELKQYLEKNPDTDLLELFENNFWKPKDDIYTHLAPDFKAGRLIASILCDAIYKKHGMEGVHQLIASGRSPNHFDPFYEIIDDLLGITKKNFHKKVKKLIDNY